MTWWPPPHCTGCSELWRDVLLPDHICKVAPPSDGSALYLFNVLSIDKNQLIPAAWLTTPGGASDTVPRVLPGGPIPLPLTSQGHLVLYPGSTDLPCAPSSLLELLCWCHMNPMPSSLNPGIRFTLSPTHPQSLLSASALVFFLGHRDLFLFITLTLVSSTMSSSE